MDLQFINVSDPQQIKSGLARHLVRSQAMRSYRHRQREYVQCSRVPRGLRQPHNKLYKPLQQSPSRNLNPRDLEEEEEVEEDVVGLQMHPSAISRVMKGHNFCFYPGSLSQAVVYRVLNYYVPTVGLAFLPNDKCAYWNPLARNIIPLAVHDTALLHAILADSGNDMMIRQGEQLFDPEQGSSLRGSKYGSIFCMKHKLEAIRIINEKLSHPAQCVSDETIIAVCHLIGLESFSTAKAREAQFHDVKIHMDGIETMVKLRGGLRTIGLNYYLTHMVLWVDYLYASITSSKPRFPTSRLFDKTAHFPPLDSPSAQLTPAGLPAGTLSPELEVILLQLRSASQYLAGIETSMTDLDFYAFGIKRAIILDAILDLRLQNPVDQCCRDAAMLYVLTVLTNMNDGVCRDLVAGLRRDLEGLDLGLLREQAPGLLLWMLMVGGGAAPHNADRAWFVEKLALCLRSAEWEEVTERLEGWPWRPKYCGPWRMAWRDAANGTSFGRVFEINQPAVTPILEH